MGMMNWFRYLVLILSVLVLSGCSTVQRFFSWLGPPDTGTANPPMRESVLGRVIPVVRKDLDRLRAVQTALAAIHEAVEEVPARYKRRPAVAALKQPWEALPNLEQQGLLLAELAEGKAVGLPVLLDVLEAGMDRTSAFQKPVPIPTKPVPKDLVSFMVESLEEASRHREKAIENLLEEEQRFLFNHSKTLMEQFSPQISNLSDKAGTWTKADGRFAQLLEERVDYANLIAAAEVLARLANEPWLRQLSSAFHQALPPNKLPSGVTGDILYAEESPYGLLLVGGTGPNTYEVDSRFGLIIDLGGDDLYRGMIAASTDPQHGNAVVIDLNGNDTYDAATFGLATGRLGVGLLIDQSGDDVYQLEMGSGGTGFGGLGILFDAKGNDIYMGNRMTQGVAIGGLGLLFDAGGNDRYTSHGFSLGFGGPQGVGAVIDLQGNDFFQCGNKYPSAYNAEDAPNGKPGDPLYQYDCFGLGVGSGKRILSKRPEWQPYNLAGGWGLLLDVEGNDHYQSANFSQGHGYFFGAGTFFDLAGNDEYLAARYGFGSSAHYGVGLFNDRQGEDRYGSTGPFYDGGVAWDHGVSVMLDAGPQNDRYTFVSTTGLGGADHSGWGLFVDEGGNDQYDVKSGLGRCSDESLGGFFDLKGQDNYNLPKDQFVPKDEQPADGRVILYTKGGLFVDR
jgi:hypothetical protein